MVAKYMNKPVVIEAVQWTGENEEEVREFCPAVSRYPQSIRSDVLYIRTEEGLMEASVGDFVIRGIKGEFYPCKPDIFEGTYGRVADTVEVTRG